MKQFLNNCEKHSETDSCENQWRNYRKPFLNDCDNFWTLVKQFWNYRETIVPRIRNSYKAICRQFQNNCELVSRQNKLRESCEIKIVSKWLWKSYLTVVKLFWNSYETITYRFGTIVKPFRNSCQTLSKQLWEQFWNSYEAVSKQLWNRFETVKKHLWNGCEITRKTILRQF